MMKKLTLLTTLFLALNCGDDTTTSSSSDTAETPVTSASLTITESTPNAANGDMVITSITQQETDVYFAGRIVTVTGTVGDYTHKIDIVYTSQFVNGIEVGTIHNVTDTWGLNIAQPTGIATCEIGKDYPLDDPYHPGAFIVGCDGIGINPEVRTIILTNSRLFGSPEKSTIEGTIIY